MWAWAAMGFGLAMASAAHAACPQELAVYKGAKGTSLLEFVASSSAMAMSHEIRLVISDSLIMTGFVGVSEAPEQALLIVPHECPQGDVTGEELAACMIYQNVIYATLDGTFVDLPAEGNAAAEQILLPGFLQALAYSNEQLGGVDLNAASEIFSLTGCQE